MPTKRKNNCDKIPSLERSLVLSGEMAKMWPRPKTPFLKGVVCDSMGNPFSERYFIIAKAAFCEKRTPFQLRATSETVDCFHDG